MDRTPAPRPRRYLGATAVLVALLSATPSASAAAYGPGGGGRGGEPTALATARSSTYSSCDDEADGDGLEQGLARSGLLGTDATTIRSHRHLAQRDPVTDAAALDLVTRSRLHAETRARGESLSAVDVSGRLVADGERLDPDSECDASGWASVELTGSLTLARAATVEVSWSVVGPKRLDLGVANADGDWVVLGGGDTRRGTVVARLGRGTYDLLTGYSVGVDVPAAAGDRRDAGSFEVRVRVRR